MATAFSAAAFTTHAQAQISFGISLPGVVIQSGPTYYPGNAYGPVYNTVPSRPVYQGEIYAPPLYSNMPPVVTYGSTYYQQPYIYTPPAYIPPPIYYGPVYSNGYRGHRGGNWNGGRDHRNHHDRDDRRDHQHRR